jgi:hypothetical protein
MVDVPILSSEAKEERDNITFLNFSLRELATNVAQLGTGPKLFDFCTDKIKALVSDDPNRSKETMNNVYLFNGWRVLAAHDGCMVVFHFGNTMGGIKALAHATPSISSVIDREKLGLATRLFSQHFHDFEPARHAVAHAGELKVDPASWKENAARVASLERSEKRELEIGGRIIKRGELSWVEDYFVSHILQHIRRARDLV